MLSLSSKQKTQNPNDQLSFKVTHFQLLNKLKWMKKRFLDAIASLQNTMECPSGMVVENYSVSTNLTPYNNLYNVYLDMSGMVVENYRVSTY